MWGAQACAVSSSKAEPTGSSEETKLECREPFPERAQAIQISGGASRAWGEHGSYDALIQTMGLCFVALDLPW